VLAPHTVEPVNVANRIDERLYAEGLVRQLTKLGCKASNIQALTGFPVGRIKQLQAPDHEDVNNARGKTPYSPANFLNSTERLVEAMMLIKLHENHVRTGSTNVEAMIGAYTSFKQQHSTSTLTFDHLVTLVKHQASPDLFRAVCHACGVETLRTHRLSDCSMCHRLAQLTD